MSVFPVREFKSAINLIYNFQSHGLSRQALVNNFTLTMAFLEVIYYDL